MGPGLWQAAPGVLLQQVGGTDLGFSGTPASQPCDGIRSGQPRNCSGSHQPEEPPVEALWGPGAPGAASARGTPPAPARGAARPGLAPRGAFISRWGLSNPTVWGLQSCHLWPCCDGPGLRALPPVPQCWGLSAGPVVPGQGHPKPEAILSGQLFPLQKMPSLPFSAFSPASSFWLFFSASSKGNVALGRPNRLKRVWRQK